MIHRMKKPDGSYTYRAYSTREGAEEDYVAKFLGAFDTSEAAKDRLWTDLVDHIEATRLRMVALRSAIDEQGDSDHGHGDWEKAVAQLAHDVASEMYFLSSNVGRLFRPAGHGDEDTRTLWREAAIEYARRHDMLVQYAELERGNYKEGFPQALTPGQAMERLPGDREHWIFVDAPEDTIPDDLPASLPPWEPDALRRPTKLDADGMRHMLDYYQRSLEYDRQKIAKLEAAIAEGVEELEL